MALIDEQLRQAIEDGKLSNLPGEGKPLKLDDDAFTPPDMRLAYKLMKDNDLAPDWMLARYELEAREKRLQRSVEKAARAYRGRLADIQRMAVRREYETQRAHEAWQRALVTFREVARLLNREITVYNLKLPPGVTHKFHFDLDKVIAVALAER